MISFINKIFLVLLLSVFVVACGDSPTGNKNDKVIINGNKDDTVDKDSDLGKEVLSRTQGKLAPAAMAYVHFSNQPQSSSPNLAYSNSTLWRTGFSMDFSTTAIDFSNHLVDHNFYSGVLFYTKKGVWFAREGRYTNDPWDNGFHIELDKVSGSDSVKASFTSDDNAVTPRWAGTWVCGTAKQFPAGTTVDDLTKIYTVATWEVDGTKYFEYLPTIRITFGSGSASIVTC